MTPEPVLVALRHVKEHHPSVCMVVFSSAGLWNYMDDEFFAPNFGVEIDQDILECAVASVDELPAVFEIAD